MTAHRRARLVPRLRVMQDSTILLGPGKADLLEAIGRSGSLREAAGALGMSYMRAWKLVGVMNEGFREPLVAMNRGGSERGGAELTTTGRAVLRLYRRMEKEALRASKKAWTELQKLLGDAAVS
jgi:molybdate transport system regulatory protein